jgi:hypothetical protein
MYSIRQLAPSVTPRDEHLLAAFQQTLPYATIQAVLQDLGARERRCRALPAAWVLLWTLAWSWSPYQATAHVWATLIHGLRLLWPAPGLPLVTKSALCQARYRLGARPLVALLHRVCQPLATPTTPGAFRFGRRLLALDGTIEDLPDTPANARVFGRGRNQQGPTAFPQALVVLLVECGTHAVLAAGVWPVHTSEARVGRRLLRSLPPDALLLYDKAHYGYPTAQAVCARGVDFLGRVPAGARLPVVQRLPDGSYLSRLYPATDKHRRGATYRVVRVVAYTFTDPHRPGHGERHRLVTSLLDPAAAPARDLIGAYHERWEVEVTIDELDTHQRLLQQPLRSQRPVGVIQEVYALLLAHYALRAVMHDAAQTVALDPRRLSFVHAVRLCSAALPDFQQVEPHQHPALYQRLLADLVRGGRLPPRTHRLQPRVVKRRRTHHPPKRAIHRRWPQPTMPFRDAVAILI